MVIGDKLFMILYYATGINVKLLQKQQNTLI